MDLNIYIEECVEAPLSEKLDKLSAFTGYQVAYGCDNEGKMMYFLYPQNTFEYHQLYADLKENGGLPLVVSLPETQKSYSGLLLGDLLLSPFNNDDYDLAHIEKPELLIKVTPIDAPGVRTRFLVKSKNDVLSPIKRSAYAKQELDGSRAESQVLKAWLGSLIKL